MPTRPFGTHPPGTLPDTGEGVATAVVGCRSTAELEADVRAAKPFEPMAAAGRRASTARFAPHPGNELGWHEKRRG